MKNDRKNRMLVCLLSLGLLAVGSGCTDNDFDLSKIDSTIGIGGDGFVLPTNSTENIVLDDILDLNNSDFVSIASNGDYIFSKNGDDCTPAHPLIDRVTVAKQSINDGFELEIPVSSFMASARRVKRVAVSEVKAGGKVADFSFNGSVSSDIRDLESAGVASHVRIDVNLNNDLKRCISTFKTLTLTLPPYMRLNVTGYSPSNMKYDAATGKVVFSNVSTSSPIYLTGVIDQLDFKSKSTSASHLTFTAGKDNKDGVVDLKGEIGANVVFDDVNTDNITASSRLVLTANMQMGDITINDATGKFDPEIDLGNLGKVDINDVPDFLSDKDVTINLYNPSITLTVNSDMAVGGKLTGKIIAVGENGNTMASVDVPEMTIKPNHLTRVCICKRNEGIDNSLYDEVKVVPSLSDLLTRIPKSLKFEADAHADATTTAHVELGKEYTIDPSYSVSAPLAFDDNAQIVYRDTLDGWHDDIEDYDLSDGSYIELTSDIVNLMPANLVLTVNAIDTEGNAISADRVEVSVSGTVKGSTDGTTPATTPLTITLKEKQKGAIKDVDGLAFKIEAAAGQGNDCIRGVTINAYKHTLKASNLKVRLVGKVIADFN